MSWAHVRGSLSVLGVILGGALLGVTSCGVEPAASPPGSTGGEDGGTNDDAFKGPVIEPDAIAKSDVDALTEVHTPKNRKAVSPLIYGINDLTQKDFPPAVLDSVTFIRRGGDRANSYNWETNVSNGSHSGGFANDLYLVERLPDTDAPAALDLDLIVRNRKAGRGTMVPFVLNDWVAGPVSGAVPFDDPGGWDRPRFFRKVGIVKPGPYAARPDLGDDMVYTDEHLAFMKAKIGEDIYAPGPSQVMVGIDNEPDLYAYNFPMLQDGSGDDLFTENGVKVGKRVTGSEFTARFVTFAKRVRELSPKAQIIGPSHYHYDGWVSWHGSMSQYSANGRWFMDDFLETAKKESDASGKRLLDTWDFHWYPQHMERETYVWDLDDSRRALTQAEIDHVLQDTRTYWDQSYDEESWITSADHLGGPAFILQRLREHIDAAYPGTKLGVSEYFPGGCAHIASGIGVVDSLGIFARMGVHLAAMWPTCDRMEFAYGGLELVRNADGRGLRFASSVVAVEHAEKAESSVYAGSDDPNRVTVLVTNKTRAERRIGLRLFNTVKLAKVAIHRIDAEHASPTLAGEERLEGTNAYVYVAPAYSATLLVFTSK